MRKEAEATLTGAKQFLLDSQNELDYYTSRLTRVTGQEKTDLEAKLTELKVNITAAQRAADDAEGMLAQADADQKKAQAVKEEMLAIDKMNGELNALWEQRDKMDAEWQPLMDRETALMDAGDDMALA